MELGYSAMHRSIHAQPVVATQVTCTEVLTGVAVFVESQLRRTGFITPECPVREMRVHSVEGVFGSRDPALSSGAFCSEFQMRLDCLTFGTVLSTTKWSMQCLARQFRVTPCDELGGKDCLCCQWRQQVGIPSSF